MKNKMRPYHSKDRDKKVKTPNLFDIDCITKTIKLIVAFAIAICVFMFVIFYTTYMAFYLYVFGH